MIKAVALTALLASPVHAGECELAGQPFNCNFGFEQTGAYANSWVAPILPADGKFHAYDKNPVPYLARHFRWPADDPPAGKK